MIEVLITLGLAVTVGLFAALFVLPWPTVLVIGAVLVAVGMATGVPAGLWYHLRLYRTLAPRGALSRRWWWNPTRLHERLAEGERAAVMGWFYLGAAGFFVAVLGCAVVVLSALRWD